MSVTWNTEGLWSPSPSLQYVGQIRYGPHSGNYTHVANATSARGYQSFTHQTVLPGLEPDSPYFYSVGDSRLGWSEEYTFQTPPNRGSLKATNVLVVGDMGIKYSNNTLRRLLGHKDQHDLLLHVGDISYADDRNEVGVYVISMPLSWLVYAFSPM